MIYPSTELRLVNYGVVSLLGSRWGRQVYKVKGVETQVECKGENLTRCLACYGKEKILPFQGLHPLYHIEALSQNRKN